MTPQILDWAGKTVRSIDRYLPLSLLIGTPAVIVIYLLTNLAYTHVFNMSQIATSKLVAADLASHILGDVGVKVVSLAVMISAFGTLKGAIRLLRPSFCGCLLPPYKRASRGTHVTCGVRSDPCGYPRVLDLEIEEGVPQRTVIEVMNELWVRLPRTPDALCL